MSPGELPHTHMEIYSHRKLHRSAQLLLLTGSIGFCPVLHSGSINRFLWCVLSWVQLLRLNITYVMFICAVARSCRSLLHVPAGACATPDLFFGRRAFGASFWFGVPVSDASAAHPVSCEYRTGPNLLIPKLLIYSSSRSRSRFLTRAGFSRSNVKD